MNDKPLPRILPFAVFMAFIGLEGGLGYLQNLGWLAIDDSVQAGIYPVKTLLVAGIIVYFWKHYGEINWRETTDLRNSLVSILAGLLVFILWVNLDFDFATQGTPQGYDPGQFQNETIKFLMVSVRLAGAVLLVPIMEELFWRSFLIRYIITSDFSKTPVGSFTWPSFAITAFLFGLEHHYILAGIVAGIIFNLLLYYTKSLSQCILSHAVANLALGSYVLLSGEWRFW